MTYTSCVTEVRNNYVTERSKQLYLYHTQMVTSSQDISEYSYSYWIRTSNSKSHICNHR